MLSKIKNWFNSINPYQKKIDFLIEKLNELHNEHIAIVSALVLKNGGEVKLEKEFLETVVDEEHLMSLQILQNENGYSFTILRSKDATESDE